MRYSTDFADYRQPSWRGNLLSDGAPYVSDERSIIAVACIISRSKAIARKLYRRDYEHEYALDGSDMWRQLSDAVDASTAPVTTGEPWGFGNTTLYAVAAADGTVAHVDGDILLWVRQLCGRFDGLRAASDRTAVAVVVNGATVAYVMPMRPSDRLESLYNGAMAKAAS